MLYHCLKEDLNTKYLNIVLKSEILRKVKIRFKLWEDISEVFNKK